MMTSSLLPSTNHLSTSAVPASSSYLSNIVNHGNENSLFNTQTAHTVDGYPSASIALDAYIGKYLGDDVSWRIRAKYEKSLEQLLIQHSVPPPLTSENSREQSLQDELQQYLAIRRAVDTSYEQLKQQRDLSETVLRTPKSHHLTTLNLGSCTNAFQSKQDASVHSSALNQVVSMTTETRDGRTSPAAGLQCFDITRNRHRHHHASLSDVFTGESSCLDDELHSGYHSDSSLDFASRNTSLWLSNTDMFGGSRGSSRSAPQSPRKDRDSLYKRCHVTADDTLTQLYSSRKTANTRIPGWVKELEESRSPPPCTTTNPSSFIPKSDLNQALDQSSFSCPASPRKQLRFDMSDTQLSSKANINIHPPSEHSKPPLPTDLKTTGILKSSRTGFHSQKGSFTTDDIPSSLRNKRRIESEGFEQKHRRQHSRSYSASGRLSSTPIKPSTGHPDMDRPYISSVSSVHSGTDTANTGQDNYRVKNAKSTSDDGHELPSKYLYKAVEKANSVSQDLGVFASCDQQGEPPAFTSRLRENQFMRKMDKSKQETCLDRGTMRAEHKDYLRDLVHDIEDRSSSIGTGYTELQDVLNADRCTHPSAVTSPCSNYFGSQLTSNSCHKPWPSLPFRRHTSAPDLSSVDSSFTNPDYHHVKDGIVDRFLRECKDINNVKCQTFNGNISGQGYVEDGGDPVRSGTMEALKNMLFTMQSITNVDSLLADAQDGRNTGKNNSHDVMVQTQMSPDDAMSPNTKNLLESAAEHGGDSLQRALRHLERLKHMVKGGKDQLR